MAGRNRPTIKEVRRVLAVLESGDEYEFDEEVAGMVQALRFVVDGHWSLALDQAWNTALAADDAAG